MLDTSDDCSPFRPAQHITVFEFECGVPLRLTGVLGVLHGISSQKRGHCRVGHRKHPGADEAADEMLRHCAVAS